MIGHQLSVVRIAFVLPLVVAQAALAGPPKEQLKPAVDRVIEVLEDPALKAETRAKDRREALRNISNEIFDWREMARRSLGRHWRERTDAERDEFVDLFRDLLERSYISTIERYNREKVNYAGESIDGEMATVRTILLTKRGQEVPIDYRMIRRGDRWLVYDVIVEHVGLVSNYRTQFNQIIQTSSYEELVRKIKSQELGKKTS